MRISTTLLSLASLLIVATLSVSRASAQDPAAPADAAPLPKAKLSDDDVKKFQSLYEAMMAPPDTKDVARAAEKEIKARDTLLTAIKKYETEKGVSSIISDEEGWRRIFAGNYVTRLKEGKDKSPSGKGTIKEESIEQQYQGKFYRFDYAYILPNGYNVEQSWPVILCLHDKGSNGVEYLRNIWDDDKELRALRDQFILVAPTLSDKTPTGTSKVYRSEKLTQDRVGWFDRLHAWQILLPLKEIRERFNCDPARTYLEGVGLGGQMAVDCTAYLGATFFAGTAIRHAQPKNLKLVTGLFGSPTLFVNREGGALLSGDANGVWADMKTLLERENIKGVEMLAKPAVEKLTPKLMGSQATDPLKDATKEIVEWFLTKKQESYPAVLRLSTDNPTWNRTANLVLNRLVLEQDGTVVDVRLEIDKASNSVKCYGAGFDSVTVHLNDAMLDLDKSVDFYLNGQLVERRTVKRDLQFMLNHMKDNRSLTHRLYTASFRVQVPAQDSAAEPKMAGEDAPQDGGSQGKKIEGEKK